MINTDLIAFFLFTMNFYSNNVAWKNDVNSKLMITTKVDMPKKTPRPTVE